MSIVPGMPLPGERNAVRAGAIIVAAGNSRRMEGTDKLFVPILGSPLLSYTLAAFETAPSIQSVVLVLNETNLGKGRTLVQQHGFRKVQQVCLGGERRQDSVRRGLENLERCSWVVIHDGARPCVDTSLIELGLAEATRWGSAVAAVQAKDTVKLAGNDMAVQQTLDRNRLWLVQTPQIFSWDVLQKAYQQEDVFVTDDAALVERLGQPVHLYQGSYANIKVTTPEDVLIAEAFLSNRKGAM